MLANVKFKTLDFQFRLSFGSCSTGLGSFVVIVSMKLNYVLTGLHRGLNQALFAA
jgi:hypothetical protein